MEPEPLTHRTPDGAIYQRPPEVEAQIASALALPLPAVIARANRRDHDDPAYLQEECLIYLIRHACRSGQEHMLREMSRALLDRCAAQILHQLIRFGLGRDLAEEGASAVEARLFTLILDLNRDQGDFLQVRFGRALRYVIIEEYRRLIRELRRANDTVAISALASYDPDDPQDDQQYALRADVLVDPERLTPEVTVLCREALHLLKPHQRDAFVLYHYGGWPIETNDPTQASVSSLLGKSPRTIRYWLNEADRVLEDWRGDSK